MREKIIKRNGNIIKQVPMDSLGRHITEYVIGTYAENEPITVKPKKKENKEPKEEVTKDGED